MKIRPPALAAILATALLLPLSPRLLAEEKVYAPNDLAGLKEMTGKTVTIEGKITDQGESKSGTVRYLNFSKNYKDTIALVFILSQGAGNYTKEKLGEFVGKKVRVTGVVGTHNDALQIKIDKLDQIHVQP
jgi:RecJ-like exonuclease